MTGRTNASIASGGSAFLAYLQVATDPNAEITAVNLAGDTFSGTADSTGALVLNITASGTYTVTETDGGEETIAIIDNGETYTISVFAFTGAMITNGLPVVDFTTMAYAQGGYTAAHPTVTSPTIYQERVATRVQTNTARFGIYKTTELFDISEYTRVTITGIVTSGAVKLVAIDENNAVTEISQWTGSSITSTLVVGLSSLDNTKKYSFGVWLGHPSVSTDCYIVGYSLQ